MTERPRMAAYLHQRHWQWRESSPKEGKQMIDRLTDEQLLALLESRAAGYGSLRGSATTAIALDKAADRIKAMREQIAALAVPKAQV